MAAPKPTPTGVVRIRFLHNINQPTLHGAHVDFGYTGGPATTDDLTAVAETASATYESDLVGLLTSDWLLSKVVVTDLSQPSLPEGEDTTTHDGTRSGTAITAGASACVIWTPNRRYRGSKPKTFFPWGVEADTTNQSQWTSTFIGDVGAAWGDFLLDFGPAVTAGIAIGGQVGISYTEGPYGFVSSGVPGRGRIQGTPRAVPLVMDITAYALTARIGSQRRRLGKSA